MKILSFRLKIILTLIVVVIVTTCISTYFFSHYLAEKYFNYTEEEIATRVNLLEEQIIYSISKDKTKDIFPLLENLQNTENVLGVYLLDNNGKMIYHSGQSQLLSNSSFANELLAMNKPLTINQASGKNNHLIRSIINIKKTPKCYACHANLKNKAGYLVVDYSMKKLEESIAFTQRAGFIFAFFLSFVIVFSAVLIHYKFIRKSLSLFNESIHKIEQGNLDERVQIPESHELGDLAKSFNEMLQRLQQTQNELKAYHQTELLNVQKLATVGEMAASLAHEIKNPLTGICNAIEVIVHDLDDEEKKPVLHEIRRQASRLNNAINDLLQFSRPVDLYLESGDINKTVKSFVFFLKSQIQEKEIHFNLKLQENIPKFKFDHAQIEKALYNIGLNAVQSIHSRGTITLSTKFNILKRTIEIRIKDTGIGISKEKLSQIFTPFFSTRHQGTGLGLAITKDIIERHNGEILVESDSLGGSIFIISLPLKSIQSALSQTLIE